MKFEFKYNLAERKRLDRLNMPHSVGPVQFALIWCACFVPTVLCLIWMQMWSILIAGGILVVMASLVPLLSRFRIAAVQEFDREIELNDIGKREVCGSSNSFVKWNHVDDVVETGQDILFSRNQRYTMLPKRLLDDVQLKQFRSMIAHWRNQPKDSNLPVKLFRELFQTEDAASSVVWSFELKRADLVKAVNSSVRPVQELAFNMKDVQSSKKSYRWLRILFLGFLIKLALILILFSLPPNRTEIAPLVIFLCLNPVVLMFAMGIWIRRRAASGVPRFHNQNYSVRLLEDGWAIGNEDLCAFNGWNQRSTFFLSNDFVGIRTDFGLIHVLPVRAFGSDDGVWAFLDRAIRMKKNWLSRKYREQSDSKKAVNTNMKWKIFEAP